MWAVSGEVSSGFLPAGFLSAQKNQIPGDEETWRGPRRVLRTVAPRLCKGEAWSHPRRSSGGAVTRSQRDEMSP